MIATAEARAGRETPFRHRGNVMEQRAGERGTATLTRLHNTATQHGTATEEQETLSGRPLPACHSGLTRARLAAWQLGSPQCRARRGYLHRRPHPLGRLCSRGPQQVAWPSHGPGWLSCWKTA